MSLLKVKGLSKTIKKKDIINDITFDVDAGEIVGLLGPNGAGKTTTFYSIAGLIQPTKGEIFINDKKVTNIPMHTRSKLGIAYLPQEPSIFQNLSVEDNILGLAQLSLKNTDSINLRFTEIVKEFNLSNILTSKGRELSGGQRRRVEIARSLVTKPKIILMDEPFAGIDPIAVDDIKKILNQLTLQGISVLITDHNVSAALEICNRALILSEGKILAEGTPHELIKNPKVKEVYLGEMYS
ncbi:LPS export ABC transporter ATP-binding protein [Gammaproteobacteria bacterium]|nr:LPS export ABC transporter ATP-binding protein [Gammaproteobacteria bacterium]